jgi:hypothetical protein
VVDDQTEPRLIILLLALVIGFETVSWIRNRPGASPDAKNQATLVVVLLVGMGALFLAFGVHWYPADEGGWGNK